MIFVTGDTHSDYTRFRTDIFPEQKSMAKADYVIFITDIALAPAGSGSNP
jgi:predicted phosphodiesterase